MDNNIYFDNNATTQIHTEVFEAMLPYINGKFFGNSSSLHSYGRQAKEAIELARFQIATAINCQPNGTPPAFLIPAFTCSAILSRCI